MKTKCYIAKYLTIQPSEIDRLPYYEFEWVVEDMMDMIEQEKSSEENTSKNTKMPKLPKYKTPKINIPKF